MGEIIYKLEHVSRIFHNRESTVWAMKDISLSINKGEIFGIIGMSGAGKSTLVRTLNRLEKVDEGRVFFEEKDLSTLSGKELRTLRQSIGMIFQNFNLLAQKTVLENVALPLRIAGQKKAAARKKAEEMLQVVGLSEKGGSYPSQLSGGQKQRVAIARALATDPKVLLCDEATSALDPKITAEILDLLKRINQTLQITIILITHEMAVVEKICNRVAIVDAGQLVEAGEVRDIFTRPKTQAAKSLVYPANTGATTFDHTGKRIFRIAFDGRAASEPLIANVTLETGEKVNILSANTKSMNGVGFGQMIIELPEAKEAQEKILQYLEKQEVSMAEVVEEEVSA